MVVGGEDGCMLGRVKSLSDMVLGYLFEEVEGEGSPQSSWEEEEMEEEEMEEDGDVVENSSCAEKMAFWESQHQLLQAAISSNSSLETKVRRATETAVRKIGEEAAAVCSCSRTTTAAKECRDCMLMAISDRLRTARFDCALCKSKWRSSPGIPSGEHSYLDVVHMSPTKRGPIRVFIEHNFRAEFGMARASQDYNALVNRLPEVFVGKPEKLKGVIKVMCTAAKRCMKDNKMHMAPWRKHKYMQAKWLSASSERVVRELAVAPVVAVEEGFSGQRPHKLRASMLTFDLLEKLPAGLHCPSVKVV